MRGALLAIVLCGCSLVVDPPPTAEHPDILVNSITVDDQANPAAVFVGGRYFVVWQDQSPESPDPEEGILSRFVSKTGEPEGVDVLVNKDTPGSQNHPQVATNGDTMLVVWFDEAGVSPNLVGRTVSPTGVQAMTVATINDTTLVADDHQITALADKNFLVVWSDVNATQDASLPGIVGRLVDASGMPLGSEFGIDKTPDASLQSEPQVARGTNNVLIVWKHDDGEGGDIHGRLLSAAGAIENTVELEINTTTGGIQSQPSVIALQDGGYFVAWTDGSASTDDFDGTAVRGCFVDDNGVVSGDFVLNDRTESNQAHPRLLQLPDRSLVVTYEDASALAPDTDTNGVRRRRIGLDRIPIGDEDQVNTFYKAEQEDPTLVLDDSGGYVVLWEDGGGSPPDNDGDSIRARIYPP